MMSQSINISINEFKGMNLRARRGMWRGSKEGREENDLQKETLSQTLFGKTSYESCMTKLSKEYLNFYCSKGRLLSPSIKSTCEGQYVSDEDDVHSIFSSQEVALGMCVFPSLPLQFLRGCRLHSARDRKDSFSITHSRGGVQKFHPHNFLKTYKLKSKMVLTQRSQ